MAELRTWRKAQGMTQMQAASALGVSLRQYKRFEAGEYATPLTVRLAAAAIARGLKPIDGQGD
jgi:transcriptional regulator with XRE-family HTH domain